MVEDELAEVAPGAALAAVLERLDPASLTAEEAVPVLKAWSRQRAHTHARMAATLARVAALSREATGPTLGEWAGSEIAAALTWTDARAAGELEFAEELGALPLVAVAFDTGRIDHGKARVFTDVLGPAELTPEQVEVLCATCLLAAPRLTSGQLRHRLTRALLAIDPEAAARRYRRAVTTRQVVGYLSADGSAVISASGLPADQAAAACARVDELAEQLRRAGHPGTITQIRADVFLRLLDGSLTGRTTPEIITILLAESVRPDPAAHRGAEAARPDQAAHQPAETAQPDQAAHQPVETAQLEPAADRLATPTRPDLAANWSTDAAQPGPAANQLATTTRPDLAANRSTEAAEPDPAEDRRDQTAQPDDAATDVQANSDQAAGWATPAAATADKVARQSGGAPGGPAGVEIRVGLGTLLGLDQRPGEIPGWGPVLPQVARDLVARYRRARWRFAVVDHEGHLQLAGTTRHRPGGLAAADGGGVEGGLVELHVTAELLAALAHDSTAHPGWAAVIADIAAQYANRRYHHAALGAHPFSRHARGPLLRHVQVRDRACVALGCRRPARRCEADHTDAYAAGGATNAANIGPLCPRHHALKHHGGWQLSQPRPGHFHWRSPLGQRYTTRGEPIMPPLPEPHPGPLPPEAGPSKPPNIRVVERPTYEAPPEAARLATPVPQRRRYVWDTPPPEDPEHPAPF